MENSKEIFYKHYLNEEFKKRNEAIDLLEKREYRALRDNRYLGINKKSIELVSSLLSDVIIELNNIQKTLPYNSGNAYLETCTDEYEDREDSIYISWKEYSIRDILRCSSLAKNWADNSDWKMKNQPNGKDGKKAIALYNELTKK